MGFCKKINNTSNLGNSTGSGRWLWSLFSVLLWILSLAEHTTHLCLASRLIGSPHGLLYSWVLPAAAASDLFRGGKNERAYLLVLLSVWSFHYPLPQQRSEGIGKHCTYPFPRGIPSSWKASSLHFLFSQALTSSELPHLLLVVKGKR